MYMYIYIHIFQYFTPMFISMPELNDQHFKRKKSANLRLADL